MDTNETTIEPLEGADAPRFDNAPIGVFDSGFGGLTVAREIAKELPRESIVYLGDSARCPYGPRSLDEVDGFVQQIGAWLVERPAWRMRSERFPCRSSAWWSRAPAPRPMPRRTAAWA